MEEINLAIEYAKDLKESGIINEYFFPLDKYYFLQTLGESIPVFREYLDTILEKLKTDRYFDLENPQIAPNKTLVLEIGGTKTTIQRIQLVSEDELKIIPVCDVISIPTLKKSQGLLTKDEFINWIFNLINENIEDCKNIAINLATAVDKDGNILFSPPNIMIEDITGINLINELKQKNALLEIHIFNDTESVTALQCLNNDLKNKQLFVDINGTGNNSSVYMPNNKIQSLETGHVKCIKQEKDLYIELEQATGGYKGIEQFFNMIVKNKNLYIRDCSAYEIETFAYYLGDKTDTVLHQLAYVIFHRMYLYKAISFICIEKYFRDKNLLEKNDSHFVLFGGINKLDKTLKQIKDYLILLESGITYSYTISEENAGRFGAALLANKKA